MTLIAERTPELCFRRDDPNLSDVLAENGLVVLKAGLSDAELEGVATAYKTQRAALLHRRLALKAFKSVGVDSSSALFKAVEPRPIEVDPTRVPRLLMAGKPAIDKIMGLNEELFADPRFLEMYKEPKALNTASFPAMFPKICGDEGFPLHQDSIGITGLSYGGQPQPTTWIVYRFSERKPLVPAYTFETERGDIVIQTQRTGPCPDFIPACQGTELFLEDGSDIHSGINNNPAVKRYGLTMTHTEVGETRL